MAQVEKRNYAAGRRLGRRADGLSLFVEKDVAIVLVEVVGSSESLHLYPLPRHTQTRRCTTLSVLAWCLPTMKVGIRWLNIQCDVCCCRCICPADVLKMPGVVGTGLSRPAPSERRPSLSTRQLASSLPLLFSHRASASPLAVMPPCRFTIDAAIYSFHIRKR